MSAVQNTHLCLQSGRARDVSSAQKHTCVYSQVEHVMSAVHKNTPVSTCRQSIKEHQCLQSGRECDVSSAQKHPCVNSQAEQKHTCVYSQVEHVMSAVHKNTPVSTVR